MGVVRGADGHCSPTPASCASAHASAFQSGHNQASAHASAVGRRDPAAKRQKVRTKKADVSQANASQPGDGSEPSTRVARQSTSVAGVVRGVDASATQSGDAQASAHASALELGDPCLPTPVSVASADASALQPSELNFVDELDLCQMRLEVAPEAQRLSITEQFSLSVGQMHLPLFASGIEVDGVDEDVGPGTDVFADAEESEEEWEDVAPDSLPDIVTLADIETLFVKKPRRPQRRQINFMQKKFLVYSARLSGDVRQWAVQVADELSIVSSTS